MKYITQVDDVHVVEVDGQNVKVKRELRGWNFKGMIINDGHKVTCFEAPLDIIMLACKVVKLIEEHI